MRPAVVVGRRAHRTLRLYVLTGACRLCIPLLMIGYGGGACRQWISAMDGFSSLFDTAGVVKLSPTKIIPTIACGRVRRYRRCFDLRTDAGRFQRSLSGHGDASSETGARQQGRVLH